MGEYTNTPTRLGLPKLRTLRSLLSRANLEFSQNNPHEGGVRGGACEIPLAIAPQFSSLLRVGNVGRRDWDFHPARLAIDYHG